MWNPQKEKKEIYWKILKDNERKRTIMKDIERHWKTSIDISWHEHTGDMREVKPTASPKQCLSALKCVYKMETSGKLDNPNGLCKDIWSLSSILYTCCIYLLQYVWKVLTGHFPSKGPCHLMLSCCGHPLKYFLSWEGVTDMVLECHLDLWWSMMIYDGVWWFLQEDQA